MEAGFQAVAGPARSSVLGVRPREPTSPASKINPAQAGSATSPSLDIISRPAVSQYSLTKVSLWCIIMCSQKYSTCFGKIIFHRRIL